MRHHLTILAVALAIAGCSSAPRTGVRSYDPATGHVLFGASDGSVVELDYAQAVQSKPEARVTLRPSDHGLVVVSVVAQAATMRTEDLELLRRWSSWTSTDDGRFGFGVVAIPENGGSTTHYLLGMPVAAQDRVAGSLVWDVVCVPYRRVSGLNPE